MKQQPPFSELLGKMHDAGRVAQQAEDAQADLYSFFINQARSWAARRMSSELKRRRTPTSLAHEALTSCLENAKTTEAPIASRDEFERYLKRHLNQRVANAARHELAQKRDMKRDAKSDDIPDLAGRGLLPVDQAAAREIAIETVHCLYEEPDEPRRAIVTLGLLLDYSASEIQEAIRPLVCGSDEEDLPPGFSLSAIRILLERRKMKLKKRFEDASDDETLDDPK